MRLYPRRSRCRRAGAVAVVAAGLVAAVLPTAGLPAYAGEALAAAGVGVGAGVVAPYAADRVGEPLFRLGRGERLPAVAPSSRPFRAIVTMTEAGGDRQFRVFVPAGLRGPAATLIAMPGWAQRSEPETYMRWERVASRYHFVVLYPRGRDLSFNAGRCCGLAAWRGVDDDAFLLQMLRVEQDLYPQNRHRLYVTGFSNGGMMAYRFACEHPGMVAAVGVVAAAYMSRPECMPRTPVPVMHIHGRLDNLLPFGGSRFSRLLQTSIPSVAQTDAVFGRVDRHFTVPVRNVYLPGVGHVWPHATGAGHYDATGQLATFLLRFSR